MSPKIKAVRGMHDILPADTPRWRHVEQVIIDVIRSYGYQEIRLPVVEKTELFSRSIGEYTDIVTKEMYTFRDRNDEMLTLRPEGTAGCVRAGLDHGLFHNQVLKLWYAGPMFRRERPQKGRHRQFHQIGIEVFGLKGPDIDAEILLMCARLWRRLGLDGIALQINTLGTPQTRNRYRAVLAGYFATRKDRLDDDSLKRLEHNPLRILDSKNPDMQEIIREAPAIQDFLDAESAAHFAGLRKILDAAGIRYTVNPLLARGLDYYGKTVFEWTTDRLGAQGTVCAGGRYDGLVGDFGGNPLPAIGCALGLERLLALVHPDIKAAGADRPHVFLILTEGAAQEGFRLAETLRNELPGLILWTQCGGGTFKSQFRKADRSGAVLALILGEEELKSGTAGVKSLRDDSEQVTVAWPDLPAALRKKLSGYLNLS